MTIIALLPAIRNDYNRPDNPRNDYNRLASITPVTPISQQLVLITQEMTIIALLPAINPDNPRNDYNRLVASN